jgi:hypothetical protein
VPFFLYHRVSFTMLLAMLFNIRSNAITNNLPSKLISYVYRIENLWIWMNYIFNVRTSQLTRLTRKALISYEKKKKMSTSILMLCAQDAAQSATKKNIIN